MRYENEQMREEIRRGYAQFREEMRWGSEQRRRENEQIRELIRSEGEHTRGEIRRLLEAMMSHPHDDDGNVRFRMPPA